MRMTMGGACCLLLLSATAVTARADEGMWTLDNLPVAQLQQRYGFTPTAAWIDHVMHASARLTLGCSASFVSPNGLVMTNHHCANECLSDLSVGKGDFMQDGFRAASMAGEKRCPGMELDRLEQISDVTARVAAATAGKNGADFIAAQRRAQAAIETECTGSDPARTRCDVVSLYEGGRQALYRYHRFSDVRLTFAPDQNIAFFGGDPDNFNYPRYDIDVTFLRAYEDGKPAHTAYFAFDPAGPRAGELVITSGNPYSTARDTTAAQLHFTHDVFLPLLIGYNENLDGILTQWSRESPAHTRDAADDVFGVENTLKVVHGQDEALTDPAVFARKAEAEAALLRWIDADPARRAQYGDPFALIAATLGRERTLFPRYAMLEGTRTPLAFRSRLFRIARLLVRAADERRKPDGERLAAFRDSNAPALRAALFSTAPIHAGLEETTLAFSLTRMRQVLGADDADVRTILGREAPAALAHRVTAGTTLADVAVRQRLFDGGAAAISRSPDPMIRLAVLADAPARRIRTQWENEIEAPQHKGSELIARARFARDGTSIAPDATFTERLSFGTVAGWTENGQPVAPFTDFAGMYRHATGAAPFDLPKVWMDAEGKIDGATHLDFSSTNDIIGGNSGSPVIDRDGHAVGLAFDGNIHSIAGDLFYDPATNRTVSVTTAALLVALRQVYAEGWLADELVGHGT